MRRETTQQGGMFRHGITEEHRRQECGRRIPADQGSRWKNMLLYSRDSLHLRLEEGISGIRARGQPTKTVSNFAPSEEAQITSDQLGNLSHTLHQWSSQTSP